MASLTTVYMISMILTSIAGFSSAFVANRIFPLTGGALPNEEPVPTVLPQTPIEAPVSENSPPQSL
jgi:hypothetical protein